MKNILLAAVVACFALLCQSQAHAACTAPCTKTQITTDINANWPDNVSGQITPSVLRSTVLELVNSYIDTNGATSFSCPTNQFLTAIATLSSYTCSPIPANVVTNSMLSTAPPDTVKGNCTGSTANVQDCTNPVISGITINPTGSTLNTALSTTQSVSGTTSANCVAGSFQFPCVNLFQITADSANASSPSTALDGWQFNHAFGGSNLQGARQSLDVIANFTAASSPSNANKNYVPGEFQMNVSSGDGGTGLTPATAKGAFFGINPIVRATAAATNLLTVTGGEVDVNTSATQATRLGWSIVSFPGTGASFTVPSGLAADTALNIGAAAGSSAIGWGHGILFSNLNGFAPISSSGCMICTDGTANTVAKGVDISAYTISGNAFASPGFSVSGAGNLTANNIVGTTTNNNAPAGDVGEFLSSTIASGSAISLTNATAVNLTSLSLTAGDWDVSCNLSFTGATTTLLAFTAGVIGSTSGTIVLTPGQFSQASYNNFAAFNAGFDIVSNSVGPFRVSLASPTTYYCVAEAGFTTSTASVYGIMRARRVR